MVGGVADEPLGLSRKETLTVTFIKRSYTLDLAWMPFDCPSDDRDPSLAMRFPDGGFGTLALAQERFARTSLEGVKFSSISNVIQSRLNSQHESLILAQNERWRQA